MIYQSSTSTAVVRAGAAGLAGFRAALHRIQLYRRELATRHGRIGWNQSVQQQVLLGLGDWDSTDSRLLVGVDG